MTVYACEAVRQVEELHGDIFAEFPTLSIRDGMNGQAQRLVDVQPGGHPAVRVHLSNWHPDFKGEELTLDEARHAIAREYGYRCWREVETEGAHPPSTAFEHAVELLINGRHRELERLLAGRPELVRLRSSYGHRATLLHYVGSNGVETQRQKVPGNLAGIAATLLAAGADVSASAGIYGGSRTLDLLMSSDHPRQAGVRDAVATVLRQAGAA